MVSFTDHCNAISIGRLPLKTKIRKSDWWENSKSSFKENARTFSANATTQENIRISRLEEDCKTYTKKKTSNLKLNQRLKTCKMNFIN